MHAFRRKKRHSNLLSVGGFAAVLLSLAVAGCSGGKEAQGPDNKTSSSSPASSVKTANLDLGKGVYERYCHFCHGRTGHGDGPVGIAISPHPADFVNDAKRMGKTDEELFKSITEGVHREIGGEEMAMPRWADILTSDERWGVLAYIRHLGAEGRKAADGK